MWDTIGYLVGLFIIIRGIIWLTDRHTHEKVVKPLAEEIRSQAGTAKEEE